MFYSDIQISPDEGEEEAEGEPDYTLLFVHGNPENSYTYRHIREHLAKPNKSLRLISPDHIGFGLSDQCDFEMAEMHHAENLAQLVRHLDLQRVFLVVHDWGRTDRYRRPAQRATARHRAMRLKHQRVTDAE